MRPIFRILADSKDVTEAISDRLLELCITDEAGIKSDQVRITLDDRRREDGGLAALPRMGMTLEVSLGYAETSLRSMGKYLVDEVELRHPPATLTVGGKAADMAGPFRSRKTRSWDNTTLGAMVGQIAGEHGYAPKVDKELGGIAIPHLDQRAESDMALLTRLAEAHDGVAKPVHGYLVLARAGEAKATTGADLPVVKLALGDITSWSYRQSARSPGGKAKDEGGEKQYGGYRARWVDKNAGGEKWVTAGDPPYAEIATMYSTEAEAKAAVGASTNKGKRKEGGLSLTLPGNPNIAAECRLHIALRPGLATDWRITKVEHRLGNSGYTTQVEAELFLKNQEKVTMAASAKVQAGSKPNPDPKPDEPDNPQWPSEEETRFELLRDSLEARPDITPKERLLLCLPDITVAEESRATPQDAQGWRHLRGMFHKWFTGPPSTDAESCKEPYFVDWNWVMSFAQARKRYEIFTDPATHETHPYIANAAAMRQIGDFLKGEGLPAEGRKYFDFTGLEWPQWKKYYHTLIPVPRILSIDGIMISLAAFTLRALASGYVEKNGRGGHTICVNKMSVFVHDRFNFEEGINPAENSLFYWRCQDPSFTKLGGTSYTWLENRDFNVFRKKYNVGRDFLVLSQPHLVENFIPTVYTYA